MNFLWILCVCVCGGGLLESGTHMSAVVTALPLAPRSGPDPEPTPRVSLPQGRIPKEVPNRGTSSWDLAEDGGGPTLHAASSPPPTLIPQNNQLEKIYPEELSRLHRLETLNLQNNRLTSRGEGSPRARDGATRQGIGCPGESPPLQTPGCGQEQVWAGHGSSSLVVAVSET